MFFQPLLRAGRKKKKIRAKKTKTIVILDVKKREFMLNFNAPLFICVSLWRKYYGVNIQLVSTVILVDKLLQCSDYFPFKF